MSRGRNCSIMLLLCWAASLVVDARRDKTLNIQADAIEHPGFAAARAFARRRYRARVAAARRQRARADAARRKAERSKCFQGAVVKHACSKPCNTGIVTLENMQSHGSNRYFEVKCNQRLCHEDRWKQKSIRQMGALRYINVTIADQDGPLGNEISGVPRCHFEVLTPGMKQVTKFSIDGEGTQEAELDGSFVEEGFILRWRGCELALQGEEGQLLGTGSESIDVDDLEVELHLETEYPTVPGTLDLKPSVQLPHFVAYDFEAPEANGDPILEYDVEVECGQQSKINFVLGADAKQVELTREVLGHMIPGVGCALSVAAKNSHGSAEVSTITFIVPKEGCAEGKKCCKGPGPNDYECVPKKLRIFGRTCSARPGWHGAREDGDLCGHL
eukprot:TRINITY_DN8697_c0_g1_i2.p1 TRINITY_DN8697_c0_g1~~TRINITY_DN8697_c0_g1_i2.p1  ORF type:complete len:388 (+),score=78.39 TRINITY_DN8697_c0_g1_i2:62-1225(+)